MRYFFKEKDNVFEVSTYARAHSNVDCKPVWCLCSMNED